jgi:hypothetical protein
VNIFVSSSSWPIPSSAPPPESFAPHKGRWLWSAPKALTAIRPNPAVWVRSPPRIEHDWPSSPAGRTIFQGQGHRRSPNAPAHCRLSLGARSANVAL